MKLSEAVVEIVADDSRLKRDFRAAKRETIKASTAMERAFDNVSKKIGNISNQLTQIGQEMTFKGALGLGAAAAGITGLIKPSAKLQKELASVNSLFSEGSADVDSYREQILKLSRQVPKNTSTLTDALYSIKSAGIESSNMFGFLKTSAVAATAGTTSVDKVVRTLTKTLEAYNLESQSALAVSSKLFRTVEKGQTTFQELAEALPTVTGAASNAGVSINELLGMFATGSKVMKNTKEVSTGVAGILRSVGKASDETKEKAEELGFEFSASALETKGLTKFLGDMRDALENSDATIRDFFKEERAYRLAVNLLGNSFSTLKDNIDAVTDSQGAINRAFGKQMNTLNNQAKLAWNNVTALAKSIGTQLIPEYTDLTTKVRAAASVMNDRFNNASDDTRESIASLISTVAKSVGIISALTLTIGILSFTMGQLLKPIKLVFAALSLLSAPISLTIGAIALLATAWQKDFKGIKTSTLDAYDSIEPVLSDIYNWLDKLWSKLSQGDWAGAWKQVTDLFGQVEISPEIVLDTADNMKQKAIQKIADAAGWIADQEGGYKLGEIVGKLLVATLNFAIDSILFIDDLLSLDLSDKKMQMSVSELVVSVAKVTWQFLSGVSDGLYQGLFGMSTSEISDKIKKNVDFETRGSIVGSDIPTRADGGMVTGPGGGRSDSILARISNGEYVVNAESTRKYLPLLESLNDGKLPAFADGGLVGGSFNIESLKQTASNISGNPMQTAQQMFKMMQQMFNTVLNTIVEQLKDRFPGVVKELRATMKKLNTSFSELNKNMKETEKSTGGNGNNKPPKKEKKKLHWFVDVMKAVGYETDESRIKLQNFKTTLKTSLSQAIARGKDFKMTIGNIFDSLLNQIAAQTIQKKLLSPAVDKILGSAGGEGSDVISGFLGNAFQSLPFFHSGGLVTNSMTGGYPGLKSNETPAVLRAGERITTGDKGVSNDKPIIVNKNIINALDAKSFQQRLAKNQDFVGRLIGNHISKNGELRKILKRDL